MAAVFITGTDTDCGKTYFSEFLLRGLSNLGLKVTGMKPIATGVDELTGDNEDVRRLTAASHPDVRLRPDLINQYCFNQPCSPNIAANLNNVEIKLSNILESFSDLSSNYEFVVVEGVGGWEVPIGTDLSVADLAIALDIPVILVVGMKLGCINHAILSADAMQESGVQILGWIANFHDSELKSPNEVLTTLTQRIKLPLLRKLSKGGSTYSANKVASAVLDKLGEVDCF